MQLLVWTSTPENMSGLTLFWSCVVCADISTGQN